MVTFEGVSKWFGVGVGGRIAILNVGGHLEQFDTPARLLAAPASDFVAGFLGEERGLKPLSLRRVTQLTAAPDRSSSAAPPPLMRGHRLRRSTPSPQVTTDRSGRW
jgi:ABC-type proline/glycine betaine transport system ATPase subunit